MDPNDIKKGLTSEQVEKSRLEHGNNLLTPPKKEPVWRLFLEKFKDPIIRILLITLILSVAVSIYQYFTGVADARILLEPLGIFIAVMLATCVGFAFELSANRKFDILNKAKDEEKVTVMRDGLITQIERKDVVVGDMVFINPGDEVPADGILKEAIALQINESALTGEPMAHKTVVEEEFDHEATYPSNYVCRGCTVIDGHGIMVVDKVGDATEWGKVYRGAQIDNKIKTPLNEQLDKLGHAITIVSYVLAGLIIGFRLLMYLVIDDCQPFEWMDFARYLLNTIMIAITLIVVAVPEGLPMSVTLSLALSMKRMLETNNLVRKMHACETMGASTVICTDKTGTLTQNKMSVNEFKIYGLHDNKLDDSQTSMLVKEGIAMNSTAFLDFSSKQDVKSVGNPTEAALLMWLFKRNVDFISYRDHTKIVKQVPFSTKYKYMATVVGTDDPELLLMYVKGAPELVLKHCSKIRMQEGEEDLVPYQAMVEEHLLRCQNQAMRTLGFAYRYIDRNDLEGIFDGEKLATEDLCYLGTAAISDPVREDVPDAIRECIAAGINVKIVTGDTSGTAKEIGRQIGLWTEEDTDEKNLITGKEFGKMSDEDLLERIGDIKIMSRARPMDKERLVCLLQQNGEVVAVTGDGTNDAPALNAAQIGLSMGDGTSVAKEASDITILDNSFHSIARAVVWGRSLYHNIQRFILFQMTINVAACLIVLLGALLGTESPLTVTQMLWVNLIMDTFAALALASLPPDRKVMQEKPRSRNAYIINRGMANRIFGVGSFFVIVLFGLIQYFKHVDLTSLADFSMREYFGNYFNFNHVHKGISPYELTLFFTIFVFMQFWNIFNAKAFMSGRSAFHGLFAKNIAKGFCLTLAIILVGQILIVTFGGAMFEVVPLPLGDWLRIILGTSVILWVGEAGRILRFTPRNDAPAILASSGK
ncbi:MAG: calcium-translocating P-type ATPase, PMCA-type [Bacteroidales bacterium]|nr:calcium-translocating P-type ATPase, PMCA-type [Bacteroidales bacterium]